MKMRHYRSKAGMGLALGLDKALGWLEGTQ